MSRVAFFEDRAAAAFNPIALTRPVFELLCGRLTLRERVLALLGPEEWAAFLRDHLAETYREEHPAARVNDPAWLGRGRVLLINGRWLPTAAALEEILEDEVGVIGETIVYLTLDSAAAGAFREMPFEAALERAARTRRPVPAEGRLLEYPWHLIEANPRQLAADFPLLAGEPARRELDGEQVAVLGRREDVHVDRTATIDPFTVLDARGGPISIGRGAVIRPFTRLEGPCHVGRGAQLFRAHVREGTSIGPECRVGGEVEASILHGCVNSYHDGFLGHAYVCPWVNMGALTTNSDLKNDYSPVRVPVGGESIDTGSNKVGCFLGDHAKTAIGSPINTGSSIGVMAMVLPGGELLPKHIPSFARVWRGELDAGLDLERAIETARTVMDRRGHRLTDAGARLLRFLFESTRGERETAVLRRQAKRRRDAGAVREAS